MMHDPLYISITIGLWAWLWTGSLTEPGQIFESLRTGIFNALAKDGKLPEGWRRSAWKVLIGCGMCHAGQLASWYQVFNVVAFGGLFDPTFIIVAMATVEILNKRLK